MLSLFTLLGLLAGEPASGGAEAAGAAARANACIVCHENQPGRLSQVVEEWRHSVHAANKVLCDGCHGGDPTLRRDQFPDDAPFSRSILCQVKSCRPDLIPACCMRSSGASSPGASGRRAVLIPNGDSNPPGLFPECGENKAWPHES